MKKINIFGDSSSEEDEPARVILDVYSDTDSNSDMELVMWSDPPPPPAPVAEPEANNTAPPAPVAVFEVDSCLCKGTQGRSCRDSCVCRQDRFECGAACSCGGLCSNGRVAEDKLFVAKSLIPGAGDGCFAAVNLGKYELAGEYRGTILPTAVAQASSSRVYHAVLTTSPGGATIDGEKNGTPATRANYRRRGPNCIAVKRFLRVENNSRISPAFFLQAIEDIPRDHELFWDYGKDYDTGSFAK